MKIEDAEEKVMQESMSLLFLLPVTIPPYKNTTIPCWLFSVTTVVLQNHTPFFPLLCQLWALQDNKCVLLFWPTVAPTLVLPTGTQRPVTGSCFSTRYSLMGRPPSSSGFSHFSLQPFLVTLDTLRGPLGFPGPAMEGVIKVMMQIV